MSNGSRRPMDVSPLWLQAMLLTFVIGFAILGYLALRVHSDHAPVPGRVVDEKGRQLMTREEILYGQEAFLTHGLMQFGSVYGHGAYLGPDFTADYLHRQAELMREFYGSGPDAEEKVRRELARLPSSISTAASRQTVPPPGAELYFQDRDGRPCAPQ